MAQTHHKYFSGGFKAQFGPLGSELDIGTTERGIRLAVRHATQPITEDRFGDCKVEELLTGIEDVIVTVDSMTWRTTGAVGIEHVVKEAFHVFQDKQGDAGDYGRLNMADVGKGLVESYAESLILTAITGKLATPGQTPLAIQAKKAVPIENIDLLLTLRRQINVPFGFRIYPDEGEFTNDLLSYLIFTWNTYA